MLFGSLSRERFRFVAFALDVPRSRAFSALLGLVPPPPPLPPELEMIMASAMAKMTRATGASMRSGLRRRVSIARRILPAPSAAGSARGCGRSALPLHRVDGVGTRQPLQAELARIAERDVVCAG